MTLSMYLKNDGEDWTKTNALFCDSGHKLQLKAINDEFSNVQKKNSPADEYQSFNLHAKQSFI